MTSLSFLLKNIELNFLKGEQRDTVSNNFNNWKHVGHKKGVKYYIICIVLYPLVESPGLSLPLSETLTIERFRRGC